MSDTAVVNLRPGQSGSDRPPTPSEQKSRSAKPGPLDAAGIAAEFTREHSAPSGLSTADAQKRLADYGANVIKAHEESRWHKLLGYFWGPIPWMIEAAALISLARMDWLDFAVVTGLLLYNAAVGFWQDNKAVSALAALKKGLALKARVLRDGAWSSIDAGDLVPGDVVSVSGGEILPADLLLTDGKYLSVDQAALTGESLPVSKKAGDSAYSGSIAKQGAMTGLVTATGNNTFFGRTAKLVATAGAKSHAEQAVVRIGDFLIMLAALLALVLVGTQVYRDIVVVGTWSWGATAGSIAQFVLVLLVASVPVAMPAVMSVTMALGALALSKQKAIVSRLSAIEELAGVDMLCSDKTGTLTMNQLTLQAPLPVAGIAADNLILGAALASQRQSEDAIDQAVLKALKKPGILEDYKQTDFVPFDPVNKKTVGIVTGPDGHARHFAKGAPQAIAALCKLDAATATKYSDEVAELASHGYRALGVARSDDDGKTWALLGLLSLMDPPRPDAKQTIAEAEKLGLSVKMVTGDDVAIGAEISHQLGLGEHLLVASDVFGKSDDVDHIAIDAARAVERADGFGRVFPEHKFEIVKALQERGHIVAMTGDGVNDAPALKQADCGVAVSGATDAARSARGPDPDRTRPFDDRQRHRRIAQDLRANHQLRLLSHRDDDRHHVRRRAGEHPVRLPAADRHHDRGAGPARRHPDHDDRLRQRQGGAPAGALGHAPDHQLFVDNGADGFGAELWAGADMQVLDAELGAAGHHEDGLSTPADDAIPAACGGWPSTAVRRADADFAVPSVLPCRAAVPGNRRHTGGRRADVRLWRARAGAALADDRSRLGVCTGVDGGDGHREARLLPLRHPTIDTAERDPADTPSGPNRITDEQHMAARDSVRSGATLTGAYLKMKYAPRICGRAQSTRLSIRCAIPSTR
jgi:H+-transporting ATPase